MRRHLPFAAALLIASTASVAAQEMPERKAGLWEITMTMEGGMPPQKMQQCIDASTDKAMSAQATGAGAGCKQENYKRSGNTISFDSVCTIGGVASKSSAVITGDFNSAYTVKVSSERAGTTTAMTIAATYAGACKADQRPGDIVMPGGMKMNITDMQRMMPGGQGVPKR